MFKLFIPIIKDVLSHTFAEAIHIATVHSIYGSNHLQKELAKEAKDTNHPKSVSSEETAVHITVTELQINCNLHDSPSNYPANKADALMSSSLSKVSPPPKN